MSWLLSGDRDQTVSMEILVYTKISMATVATPRSQAYLVIHSSVCRYYTEAEEQ